MCAPALDGTLSNPHSVMRSILQPDYDHASEFGYGLDLILDALEDRRGPK